MQKPLLVDLRIFHDDCPYIPAGEAVGETKLVTAPYYVREGDYINVYSKLSCPDPEAFAKRMRESHCVKSLDFVSRHGGESLVKVRLHKDASSLYRLLQSDGFPIDTTLTMEGHDYHTVLFPGQKNLKEFVQRSSDHYEIGIRKKIVFQGDMLHSIANLKKIGFLEFMEMREKLSARQREVFALACKRGYYAEPKKIGLEDVAREMGLHPNTVADHLRKAEGKLMPIMNRILAQL